MAIHHLVEKGCRVTFRRPELRPEVLMLMTRAVHGSFAPPRVQSVAVGECDRMKDVDKLVIFSLLFLDFQVPVRAAVRNGTLGDRLPMKFCGSLWRVEYTGNVYACVYGLVIGPG